MLHLVDDMCYRQKLAELGDVGCLNVSARWSDICSFLFSATYTIHSARMCLTGNLFSISVRNVHK